MITASNSLTFIRAPLALLFLQESPTLRILAIVLAMITDSVDGYIARRNQSVSTFGAILDPAMDKFFVYFAMTVLFYDQKMQLWEMMSMLSRVFSLCMYGILMSLAGKWKSVIFQSIKWGKITTALQFIVLIGLVLGYTFSWHVYFVFCVMGLLAFLELFHIKKRYSKV